MNIRELKAEMVRKDKTAEQLCAAIGISKSAWWRKTTGQTQFTQSEMIAIRNELGLDDHQIVLIFFDENVS